MKHLKYLVVALGLLASPANAGTIYVDITANGALAANSGGTDTTCPTNCVSGTLAVWTTAVNSVALDTNTNLTGIVTTPGATQSSINLSTATNQNRTIFWIASVTGCTGAGACTITLDTAPTCTGSGCTGNAWVIGGRFAMPSTGAGMVAAQGALRAGDTMIVNTDSPSKTTSFIQAVTAGDVVSGPVTIKGKSGAGTGSCPGTAGVTVSCPKIVTSSGSTNPIQIGVANWTVDTLDIENSGTGFGLQSSGPHTIFRNNRSAGGVNAVNASGFGNILINNDLSGATGDCVASGTQSQPYFESNYIHGCTGGNGITNSATSFTGTFINNIITGNIKGISLSGASSSQNQSATIRGNVIYGNTGDGLNVANANTALNLIDNIFQDNGQTSGYNVNLASGGSLAMVHTNNVFYQSGAGTPTGNLNNLAVGTNEFTTNPGFVAPSTTPPSANFAIASTGSAYKTGTPLSWGSANTLSYPNIGAAMNNASAGGASNIIGGGL